METVVGAYQALERSQKRVPWNGMLTTTSEGLENKMKMVRDLARHCSCSRGFPRYALTRLVFCDLWVSCMDSPRVENEFRARARKAEKAPPLFSKEACDDLALALERALGLDICEPPLANPWLPRKMERQKTLPYPKRWKR